MLINFIVSLTNFVGLYFIGDHTLSTVQAILMYSPMIASAIYHLAETKHGLTGIVPLNIYANELLNVDRFFAVISFCVVVKCLINCNINKKQRLYMSTAGLIGLVCLFVSERDIVYEKLDIYADFKVPKYQFLIFHSFWHIYAFRLLSLAIKKIYL
jgi:hypothetical protein